MNYSYKSLQFYITTGENIEYLDGKHTIFGKVVEGLDIVDKINNTYIDKVLILPPPSC